MTEATIAFIGAGNMASSIIGGLVNDGWPAARIIASNRTTGKLDALQKKFGIKTSTDNHQAVTQADVVVLAVKPQMMQTVLNDLAPSLDSNKHLLISVAAGTTIESLEQWTSSDFAIVRSMPNTPSLLQCGATGLFANANTSESQKQLTNTIFDAIGISEWVANEALIDSVIAISGSGPAYFFLFMEAMKKTGVELGLDEKTAERLTLQTALGAARMAVESDVDAAELRRRVTSPNGVTEQAINSFQQDGLEDTVTNAMQSAVRRAQEMAKELS